MQKFNLVITNDLEVTGNKVMLSTQSQMKTDDGELIWIDNKLANILLDWFKQYRSIKRSLFQGFVKMKTDDQKQLLINGYNELLSVYGKIILDNRLDVKIPPELRKIVERSK